MDSRRTELAEAFLREAVYRSRASQAAVSSLLAPKPGVSGNCGLGEKAAIELDLGDRGLELFRELWRDELAPTAFDRVREVMRGWIERQDALDRKRNHFLKDFRGKHGFDRTTYGAEELASYDAGLARINEEENRARRAATEQLAEIR